MSDAESKTVRTRQERIGSALAVLLTIAIVIVVFWNHRPFGGASRPPDVGDRLDGNRSGWNRFETGIWETTENSWRASTGPVMVDVFGKPASQVLRLHPFR